jgi:hypothetical protein
MKPCTTGLLQHCGQRASLERVRAVQHSQPFRSKVTDTFFHRADPFRSFLDFHPVQPALLLARVYIPFSIIIASSRLYPMIVLGSLIDASFRALQSRWRTLLLRFCSDPVDVVYVQQSKTKMQISLSCDCDRDRSNPSLLAPLSSTGYRARVCSLQQQPTAIARKRHDIWLELKIDVVFSDEGCPQRAKHTN